MKSLHYDQCLYDNIIIYIYSLFHRDETKPTHIIRNKFIPVLNATHLQAFKPKLSTYDQLLKINQQDVSLYMYVCISWNIFNCIHFFAICDVILCVICSFLYDIYIYDYFTKVDEAASTNFFFSSYTIFISYC